MSSSESFRIEFFSTLNVISVIHVYFLWPDASSSYIYIYQNKKEVNASLHIE